MYVQQLDVFEVLFRAKCDGVTEDSGTSKS